MQGAASLHPMDQVVSACAQADRQCRGQLLYLQSTKLYFCRDRNGVQSPLMHPGAQFASERLSAGLFWGKFIYYFLGKLSLKICLSPHNCTISLSFSVAIWPYLPLRSLQGSVCSQLGTCCLLVPHTLGWLVSVPAGLFA